jgi:ribosomal protein S4
MVIYRLRFLPTIFACNQLIHHYGVCVNNQIEKIPHSLIKLGDSITLAKAH